MNTEYKFTLGSEVRCTITGYKGVIIGRSQWLHGCNTYQVKSKELKDGKPMESVAFDEAALELVVPVPERKQAPKNGGPPELRRTDSPSR